MSSSTAKVLGVNISYPVGVYQTLMQARERISNKAKWNSSGWYDPSYGTMCLANVVRFVAYGRKGRPSKQSNDPEYRVVLNAMQQSVAIEVEALTLAVINRLYGGIYNSIPGFNDTGGRSHTDILKVLDFAAEQVKPLAEEFSGKITIATEVLSDKEKQDMADEVRAELWGGFDSKTYLEYLKGIVERGWDLFPSERRYLEKRGVEVPEEAEEEECVGC